MKYHSLILLLFSFWVCSQSLITTSPEKLSSEITHFDIVGKVGNQIILHKYGKNVFEINAYNEKDLSLAWSKDLAFKYKKLKIIDLIITSDGAFCFYSIKQGGVTSVLVQPYDFQFRVSGEPLLICDLNYGDELVRLNHNVDRSLMLLEIIDKKSGNNLSINVIAFDSELNKLFEQHFERDNDWEFKETFIGISGNVVLAFEKNKGGIFQSEGIEKIEFVKANTTEPTTVVFENELVNIENVKYAHDLEKDEVKVVGVYSEGNDQAGYVYTSLNVSDMELNATAYNLFDEELIEATGRKAMLGTKSKMDELKIQSVVSKRDGSIVIGEFFNEGYIANTSANIYTDIFAGRERDVTTYEYGDLVVFRLDEFGTLLSYDVLRKRQYSENDRGLFSSVGLFNTGKDLHLVFNEKIDYISPVNSFTINEDGVSGINTLFNSEKYDMLMSPKHGEQLSRNQMIIPAYTTRNYFVLALLEW